MGVEVLKTLKRGKGYVRGTRGNSLTIEVVLQNLEGMRAVMARTLAHGQWEHRVMHQL